MTGLLETDRIIEIACIVTDGQLNPLDDGVAYAIRTPKEVLDQMSEWCVKVHGKSGLTANCLDGTISRDHADVRAGILAYVRERIPEKRVACLAGSTVHADAVFLKRETPEVSHSCNGATLCALPLDQPQSPSRNAAHRSPSLPHCRRLIHQRARW